MRRLVIASASAQIPSSWSDAEIVRGPQIAVYTPPGCVGRAIEWTQKISEMQVTDHTLIDILRYGDTSLWWFIHTLVFSSTKQAILTIERGEQLLQEKSPDQVLVAGIGGLGDLIAQLCDRANIHCSIQGRSTPTIDESLVDNTKITLGRILLRIKELRRKRISKSTKNHQDRSERPRVLVLSPSANWRSVLSYESGKHEKRDVFMGRLIREIQTKGFDVIGVDVDYSLNGRVDILRDKISNDGIEWVAFEQYFTNDVKSKLRLDPNYGQLNRAFALLDRSDAFKRNLQYNSVGLWGFMRGRFRRALSGLHALHDAQLIEAAREMLRVELPDAVAMTYETGAYARAAIVAAWEKGIPTLGVQHGFITPNSVEYLHPRTARSRSEEGCPVPTKTTLGGQYSVEILTNLSSYGENAVEVTGYTRHDDLAELKRNESRLSKRELLASLGLSAAAKTIMIASGGFHSKYGWTPEYDKVILQTLLTLSEARPDTQLLVRLHPMEDGVMQCEIIGKHHERCKIVKGERNDLLWASDLLVTVNSALALDALILGKPILMLEGGGENVPIVDLGNAATFYSLENLSERVTNVLDTPDLPEEKRMEMQSQMVRHANSVDGHASFRAASILCELAKTYRDVTQAPLPR